jgi:hypothetical protein
MKIALVAATGHIGSHIAARALQRGHQLTAIARSARTLSPELGGAKLAVAALDDASALIAAVRGHDVLASAYGPGAADAGTIVAATRQLIDAARAAGNSSTRRRSRRRTSPTRSPTAKPSACCAQRPTSIGPSSPPPRKSARVKRSGPSAPGRRP